MKKDLINNVKLKRVGLVAGSIALGLVIGIYATYQFMLGTTADNIDKIVDVTVEELQYTKSGTMTKDAISDLKENVKKVLFEKDKGGILK